MGTSADESVTNSGVHRECEVEKEFWPCIKNNLNFNELVFCHRKVYSYNLCVLYTVNV